MRVLVALGGAMTGPDGSAAPHDQVAAIERAAGPLADVVTHGIDLVLTHGNGPQVGNLLVKNEIAASVVPPVPLDWCGAQTQATIGFVLVSALEQALHARNTHHPLRPWSPGAGSMLTIPLSRGRPPIGSTSPPTKPRS